MHFSVRFGKADGSFRETDLYAPDVDEAYKLAGYEAKDEEIILSIIDIDGMDTVWAVRRIRKVGNDECQKSKKSKTKKK